MLRVFSVCAVLILAALNPALADCAAPARATGAIVYNADHKVFQYCNGVFWKAMNAPGGGSGGCGTYSEGKLFFNVDHRVLQGCAGNVWRAMGPVGGVTVTNGLVGWYKLNETSGTAVTDLSGNGNNGTMQNGLTGANTTGGPAGGGLNFDGTDDIISIPHSATLNFNSGYTFSTWVFFDSTVGTNVPALFGKNGDGGWGDGLTIGRASGGGDIIDGKIHLNVAHNRDYSVSIMSGWDYPVDEWVYVTVTWDTSNLRFYVNGALVDTQAYTRVPDAATGEMHLGCTAFLWGGSCQKGPMEDVRLYNRALNDAEVAQLYTSAGGSDLTVGLVGYWKLDETSGTTALDVSGNRRDGTMNGGLTGAASVAGKSGTALAFNGTTNVIRNTGFPFVSVPFSFSAWFKPANGDTTAKSSYVVWSHERNFYIRWDSDFGPSKVLGFVTSSGGGFNASLGSVTPGQWTHIVGTYDGSVLKAYNNGVLVDSNAASYTPGDENTTIAIGEQFEGAIDDVHVYDRALSDTEVLQLYSGEGSCNSPSRPIGTLLYNSNSKQMQYCNGSGWVGILHTSP